MEIKDYNNANEIMIININAVGRLTTQETEGL